MPDGGQVSAWGATFATEVVAPCGTHPGAPREPHGLAASDDAEVLPDLEQCFGASLPRGLLAHLKTTIFLDAEAPPA